MITSSSFPQILPALRVFRTVAEPRISSRSAKFTKKTQTTANSLKIVPNTCRYNIFETYLSCWSCLLGLNLQIYGETSSLQRVNNIHSSRPWKLGTRVRQFSRERARAPLSPRCDVIRAQPTAAMHFGQRKCQNYMCVALAGKSQQTSNKQYGGAASKFISFRRQLQNRRKHRFWVRNIFLKRQ